jgi:hypothetical protein
MRNLIRAIKISGWPGCSDEFCRADVLEFAPAGLPALQGGESGQVRKEAATATYCKCRGLGSPLSFLALVWSA